MPKSLCRGFQNLLFSNELLIFRTIQQNNLFNNSGNQYHNAAITEMMNLVIGEFGIACLKGIHKVSRNFYLSLHPKQKAWY